MDLLSPQVRCNYYYYLLQRPKAYLIFEYLKNTGDFACIGDAFIRKITLYGVQLPYYTDLVKQYQELYGRTFRHFKKRIPKNNIRENNRLFDREINLSIREKHLFVVQKIISFLNVNIQLDIDHMLRRANKIVYYTLNYLIQYYPHMFINYEYRTKTSLFARSLNLKLAIDNSEIFSITSDDLRTYVIYFIMKEMQGLNYKINNDKINNYNLYKFLDQMEYLMINFNINEQEIFNNIINRDYLYFFKYFMYKYPNLRQYYLNNRQQIFDIVLENGNYDIFEYIINDGIYFPYKYIIYSMQAGLNETINNGDTTTEFMDIAVRYGVNPFNNETQYNNIIDYAVHNTNTNYLKYIMENFSYIVFRNTITLGVREDYYSSLKEKIFDKFTNNDTKAFNILNLILAVVYQNFEMLKYLNLEHGVDVSGLNNTALVQSVLYFDIENNYGTTGIMKYLIEHGADVTVLNRKYDNGYEWLIEKLLKHPYYNSDPYVGVNSSFIKQLVDKGLDISFLSPSEKRRYNLE